MRYRWSYGNGDFWYNRYKHLSIVELTIDECNGDRMVTIYQVYL